MDGTLIGTEGWDLDMGLEWSLGYTSCNVLVRSVPFVIGVAFGSRFFSSRGSVSAVLPEIVKQ